MTTTTTAPAPAATTTTTTATGRRRRRRRTPWVSSSIAILFCIVWAFPVYWMINTAFKPRSEMLSSTPHFLPESPTLDNFFTAIGKGQFHIYLQNSVIVVTGAVVFAIVLGLFAAAALSRFRFRGRRPILVLILIVQMLPGTALLIPQFLIFNSMGLLGTYWGLILSYVASVLPFSIWVMRGFFLAIPIELDEAARIDGATTWQVLTRVLFPLVMPGIISSSVFAFIAAWNDYIVAFTFMKDQANYTLPVWLNSFTVSVGGEMGTDYGGQMAAATLFALPVVVFFMIIQRNLVTGMSAGAVKG
ncbi:N,N'-diacetylchitobiose transport system permease protein [Microbacterium phyllosphaerae]|uniref:N,N'-diacetylchitobiose transport system permease protein n=1 Tax=Microbacterium phyllosphaerae TaxID=124798 RepID=A0ABS4WMN2_9MICO|nr:carbohydrate ABC transporter permease [Microbacterium phyllosphaerae]MBP2377461.1 N,N'-diacetylchitobiose transport system permease protein [Microbacterium phyllosphaerae]